MSNLASVLNQAFSEIRESFKEKITKLPNQMMVITEDRMPAYVLDETFGVSEQHLKAIRVVDDNLEFLVDDYEIPYTEELCLKSKNWIPDYGGFVMGDFTLYELTVNGYLND